MFENHKYFCQEIKVLYLENRSKSGSQESKRHLSNYVNFDNETFFVIFFQHAYITTHQELQIKNWKYVSNIDKSR